MKNKMNRISFYLMLLFSMLANYCNAQLQKGYDAVITHSEDGMGIPHAQIIRIGNPTGAAIPTVATATNANLPNVNAGISQPPSWATLYNVFGVTIDNNGSVYFANSSMYSNFGGKSLTSYNAAGQVQLPTPTVAIYKANNLTLAASPLCSYSTAATASTIGSNQLKTNGFGLGNICNSPTSARIYASSLDDGRIYEINSNTGVITDIFDPFGLYASSALIAPFGQRIAGVGINTEPDGTLRLYYARQKNANENEIWSVKINAAGGFVSSDNSLEINVRQLTNSWTAVTDITFSNKGYMAFAERANDDHNSTAFECYGKHNAWSIPKELVTGTYGGTNAKNTNGGITYGSFKSNSDLVCDSLLWVTTNYINYNIYGGHSIPSIRTLVTPNVVANSYVYDNNNSTLDGTATKGHFGDIEFFDSCSTQSAINPCNDVSIISNTDSNCCVNIKVKNNFNANYISSIVISSPTLTMNSSNASGLWGGLISLDAHTIIASNSGTISTGNDTLLPLDITDLGKICFSGPPGKVYFKYIGNAPQYDTVCVDSIDVLCTQPNTSTCIDKVKDSIVCDKGNVIWYVQIKNMNAVGSGNTISGITLHNTNPDIEAVSSITNGGQPFFVIPALAPGQTSAMIMIPLSISNNASAACFTFDACDPTSIVNNQVQSSLFCCSDTTRHCIVVPNCNPCNGAFEMEMKLDKNGNCCAKLSLINNYLTANLEYIELTAINGTSIVSTDGWIMIPPASSTFRRIKAPGAGMPAGFYSDFLDICIGGTSTAPHQIIVKYITSDSSNVCLDTLNFDQCDIVKPRCGVIIKDSIYCLDNKTYYTFSVENQDTFAIGQIDLNIDKSNLFTATPNIFQPNPPIQPGASAGPFTVELDTINGGDEDLCLYLSAHNAAYTSTSAPNHCCSDINSKICYPFLDCKNNGCCEFDEMQIPNGITPNGDGINDLLDIVKPTKCDSISITIFNRWGNIVYKDINYMNNWGGKNQQGQLLPQGTYFMIIELKNGSKKGMYVDVRY